MESHSIKAKIKEMVATEVYNAIPNINGFKLVNESGLRNPRTVQYFVTAEREGKFHPTQKPVALLFRIPYQNLHQTRVKRY